MLYQLSYTRMSAGQLSAGRRGGLLRSILEVPARFFQPLPRRPAAHLPRFNGGGRIRTYVGR